MTSSLPHWVLYDVLQLSTTFMWFCLPHSYQSKTHTHTRRWLLIERCSSFLGVLMGKPKSLERKILPETLTFLHIQVCLYAPAKNAACMLKKCCKLLFVLTGGVPFFSFFSKCRFNFTPPLFSFLSGERIRVESLKPNFAEIHLSPAHALHLDIPPRWKDQIFSNIQ